MRHKSIWNRAAVLALCCCAFSISAAHAELFVLTTGGRFEGVLLNPQQSPRETYVVKVDSGAVVTLPKAQVTRVVEDNSSEKLYAQHLGKMPDTVEGHWTMAEWCVKKGLLAQREFHLQAIVAHEPGHEQARLALGYNNIDGRWIKPDDHAAGRGLVKHKGAWRTPQDIVLAESRAKADAADRQWRADIKTWRSWLSRNSKSAEGLANLRAIRDPQASPAIVDLIDDAKEPPAYRLLYAEILGEMANNSPLARGALVNHALYNKTPEVREKCLEYLERCDRRAVAPMFATALGDKDNKVVNRAAAALGRLEATEHILDLIEALRTKHKFAVTTGSGGGGGIGASFSPGNGSFSAGGKTTIMEQEINNDTVLTALVALTGGKNLGYDKNVWLEWFASTRVPKTLDLRRRP
jgi:hypothetical protein